MKKLITISIITALSLQATTVDELKAYINKLNSKIDSLQNQVKTLQNKLDKQDSKKLYEKLNKIEAQSKDNADYIDEVDGDLEKLTASVLKNGKVGFTRLKFDTTMHNFQMKFANGETKTNSNVDTLNLKLDLEKEMSPKITFRGQISIYKYWGNGEWYPDYEFDSTQGRVPADSALYVTRAYIDWKVWQGNVPMTLTIGRQPSSSGPSWQYSNNGVRYGTYDALVFDGNADGAVATFNLKNVLPSITNPVFRIAYGKGFQDNNFYRNEDIYTDTDVYGVFFESEVPSIQDSFMQIYYAKAANLITPGDKDGVDKVDVGDISWAGFMMEFNKVHNFDLFAHFSTSISKPNGNLGTFDEFTNVGLLTNTKGDTETKTGYAMWLGARYNFTSKAKLGIEYGHGSKNWINITQGSDSILNPRSVRGDVIDVYGIYPIDKSIGINAFIKVGATLIDYDYTGSGVPYGEPIKISSDMGGLENYVLDKLNDYYINLQVNY
ncbi:MAG: DUF3373 family protein [Epsilonproteobacteria bacterium]|nr:DUF3373 family protein [Campylobacterota bacterium]